MIRSQLPRRPRQPRRPPRCAEVAAFFLVPTRALPTVRAPNPPSLFAPACGFGEAPVPCSASRPLPRPLLCPGGVRPRAVCAHTLTSPCAVREMRLQGEGGAGVYMCVCGERSNGGTNAGARSICLGVASASAPSLFCMRTYPPCAHAHPTPRSPLHRSLPPSPLLSLCRVGISGRAPSSTPCFQVGR